MGFLRSIRCVVDDCTKTAEVTRCRVAGINGTTIAFDWFEWSGQPSCAMYHWSWEHMKINAPSVMLPCKNAAVQLNARMNVTRKRRGATLKLI